MFGCFYKNELENKMPGMTIENIAAACEGTFVGDRDLVTKEIAGAVTDSRQVQKDYLFIPIKGARVDGHDFIPQVFEKGALVVLSDHALPEETGPYILVSSTTEAMKKIAAFYRTQLSCKVVGITGSVGKTSTKEMIASVLEQRYKVLKTEGNFNNEIGLPLTIFKIRGNGNFRFWRDAPSGSDGTAGYRSDHKYWFVPSGKSWYKRRNSAGKDRNV